MLKKRLIFTLLYDKGQFVLSRNFRLQNVGDLRWLQTNYNFSHISYSIDELIVLNVGRGDKKQEEFCAALKELTEGCFVPIAAGGGVNSLAIASDLLRSGADKVVVNSALYRNDQFVGDLATEFGEQCIVAAIDVRSSSDGAYEVWSECGSRRQSSPAASWIAQIAQAQVGELYVNSMDRDGTGKGYDMELLDLLPQKMQKPVILAGGVGNATHLAAGLADSRVDAVATAHLFNFIGDGLKKARQSLISSGVVLPLWDIQLLEQHLGSDRAREIQID